MKSNMDGEQFKRSCMDVERINLTIIATTGGTYQLSVSHYESIGGLKYMLARKLSLHAERMSLLFKNRLLLHGTLFENRVGEGSQLTLVPNMETGTSSTMTDSRVMQALENLTESQVNDFLTGRAPLLLAMKLGEHMMFVQLQLSTSSCASRRRSLNPSHCGHASNSTCAQYEKSRCSCNHGNVHNNPGATIDSINHLGHGVYSGTFSGTLDPSIQNPTGKPKRDINTILQILNDLLVASPQFHNNGRMFAPRTHHYSNLTSQNQKENGQVVVPSNVDNEDNNHLRGKVQSLQRRMQERRMRRQEKRGMRAPYQWTCRRSALNESVMQSSRLNFESSSVAREREVGMKGESLPPADAAGFSNPAAATMEQEGVLV